MASEEVARLKIRVYGDEPLDKSGFRVRFERGLRHCLEACLSGHEVNAAAEVEIDWIATREVQGESQDALLIQMPEKSLARTASN